MTNIKNMKFSELAKYFEKIEETSSRITITVLLAELFKKLKDDEIDKAVYLLQGRVAPIFEKTEFGMAEKMVLKSIMNALQLDKNTVDNEYRKYGDVGKTAAHLKLEIKSLDERDLSIREVFDELYRMAVTGGAGSQDLKINILSHLIRQLDPLSAGYLVRIPLGVMRLGFSDMTILDALSWMITGDKSLRPEIERAFHVRPDLGFISRVMKEKGIKGLTAVQPKISTPILMMRAERLSSTKDIIEKIGKCIVESKYDGFRIQLHFKKHANGNTVHIYSRNLEDVSLMYPDIVQGLDTELKADEIIFEGEAIGFDVNTGSFLPFQATATRKRKYGIEDKVKEIPLKVFAFELLYLNGKNYIHIPFVERRRALEKAFNLSGDIYKDTIIIAPETVVDEAKTIELLFDDAISKGLEGVVAKKLDGVYQPGARGWNWIKFKRSYSSKIDDSIDCLVMGFDYGKGKRAGFGIGAFLVGVRDEKADKFVTVAKIGTGLSDLEWKALQVKADGLKAQKKSPFYDVDNAMECDVWIKPEIVVEIKADEITRSTVHTAGRKLKPSKSGSATDVDIPGYALRFPRLVRFREDKRPEDATTLSEIEHMFSMQKK